MLALVKEPDPILKQVAEPWDFNQHINAQEVEHEMFEIMKVHNGIGLAGNQVGLLRRVFVMKLQDGREIGCFNPTILIGDNNLIHDDEGCLSFPELWLKVPRHNKITAMYLDNIGTKCIIELEGIDARCFQHELDHLDGITFTEHVSILKLAFARKKQQRKRNGRTK
jgi:peptide deformylase